MHGFEPRGDVGAGFEHFGIEPDDVDLYPVGEAAVDQRFVQRFIGIGKADIFADDADGHFAFGVAQTVLDIRPARQVGVGGGFDPEGAEDFLVQSLAMILQRHGID